MDLDRLERVISLLYVWTAGHGPHKQRAFGDYLRFEGAAIEFIRDHGPALLQLARAVNDSPRGVVTWDASVRVVDFIGDEPEWPEGQTVALVPVPTTEGKS